MCLGAKIRVINNEFGKCQINIKNKRNIQDFSLQYSVKRYDIT